MSFWCIFVIVNVISKQFTRLQQGKRTLSINLIYHVQEIISSQLETVKVPTLLLGQE